MSSSKQYDVFLCHSSADKEAVEHLARRLLAEGIVAFLDKWHLVPGQNWVPALGEALDASRSCAVFVGPSRLGPWANQELCRALDTAARDASFPVFPVLLKGLPPDRMPELPHFLGNRGWVDFRLGLEDQWALHVLKSAVRGLPPGPGPAATVQSGVGTCPYQGLYAFDVEHDRFFKGREELINQLLTYLSGNPMLALIGPSGAGKSSLARAGLIHRLHQGGIDGSSQWPVVTTVPGDNPFRELARSVCRQLPMVSADPSGQIASVEAALRTSDQPLKSYFQIMVSGSGGSRFVLLLVDQFEQLFRSSEPPEGKAKYISNLLELLDGADKCAKLVMTIGSECLDVVRGWPKLGSWVEEHAKEVAPLGGDDLRRAIREPAHSVGVRIEEALVDRLLEDSEGPAGRSLQMAIAQHTLWQLWQEVGCNGLTLESYRKLGGVQGLFSGYAEKVYADLAEPLREPAKRLLLSLVHVGGDGMPGLPRPVRRSDLPVSWQQAGLIETLSKKRLLAEEVGPGAANGVVSLAHAALLQPGTTLAGWIEQDRAGLLIDRRLKDNAQAWDRLGRPLGSLKVGSELAELEGRNRGRELELGTLELDYLNACRERERQSEAEEREGLLADKTLQEPDAFSSAKGAKQALTLLTRLAQRLPEGEHRLRQVLEDRLDDLAGPALEVAVETGDPIGKVLAEVLSRLARPSLIEGLAKQLMDGALDAAIPLREVALTVQERWLAILHARHRAEVADARIRLGSTQAFFGHWEAAAQLQEEAVSILRGLESEQPGAHRTALGRALLDLAVSRRELGRVRDAEEILAEVIDLLDREVKGHDA